MCVSQNLYKHDIMQIPVFGDAELLGLIMATGNHFSFLAACPDGKDGQDDEQYLWALCDSVSKKLNVYTDAQLRIFLQKKPNLVFLFVFAHPDLSPQDVAASVQQYNEQSTAFCTGIGRAMMPDDTGTRILKCV